MTREDAIKKLKEARSTIQPFRYVDEAIDYAIKALEQEPCEDAISRQAVKEQMIKYGFHAPDMTVTEFVEALPSVSTEKTGRWIKRESEIVMFECSVCKDGYIDQPTCMGKPMFKYCPCCGAKMGVEE